MQGKDDRTTGDKTLLWRALKRTTEGESRKVVTSTKGEDGFKAWYALNRRFEPSVSARHGAVMADFTGMVGRPDKTPGELQTLMTEIMRKIKIIEDITGQEVPDMMAKAVLLGVLDPLTRQHAAAMHSQDFTKLRVRVLEFASNAVPSGGKESMDTGRFSGFQAQGQESPGYDPTWDEEGHGGFNAIGKGGKGKGKGSGECHHCGEKGHFKRECPKLYGKGGKGDSKGSGKGMWEAKGGGKGKGGGFQGDCYNCGKPGHTSRECWKGKGKGGGYGPAGGKGGMRTLDEYWGGQV